VVETKPEKPAAPALVPSVQEKQPAVVVEEVKAEVKEQKKEIPSEPSMERPGPPEIEAEPEGQTIVVERGDTLEKLSNRVYGRSSERILGMIQKNNPAIKDPDFILPGQKVQFPPLPEKQQ
jgi:nucleoid-associated protein YgaU